MWRDNLKLAEEKDKKTKKVAAKKETKPKAAEKKPAAKAAAKPKAAAKAKATAKEATPKVKAKAAAAEKPAVKAEAKPKAAAKEATPKVKAEAAAAEKPAAKAEAKPKAAAKPKKSKVSGDYVPRMRAVYNDRVIPYMIDKFKYNNPNMVPKLEKISINTRLSKARDDEKDLENAVNDITIIAGQKAVVTKARKAIANFKIREGDAVGGRVTIRGRRMYEFLDRMISIAIPRVRDFNGLRQKSFDGFGNYSFGVKEQIIFPEIDYDKVDKIRGMDITIVTTANTDEEGFELLSAFGMPFRIHTTENQGTVAYGKEIMDR